MAEHRNNAFYYLRLTLLLSLFVVAVLGWRFVDTLGGPTQIIPELLRTHLRLEADSASALDARVAARIRALAPANSLDSRLAAARDLAAEGLARKKSFSTNGLSLNYGITGAQLRIANTDNSDLHAAANALVASLNDDSEWLRLEAAYALANAQLTERHAPLVQTIQSALDSEYNPASKIYLVRTLGAIGPPAAPAADSVAGLLYERDPVLLASAAAALARMGPVAHTLTTEAQLLQLMTHADPSVRDASAEALGALGALTPAAEDALRKALDDDDSFVRVAAALALTDIGVSDGPVLNVLNAAYSLAPRSVIYVEDVARVASIRRRVTGIFTALGEAPEALVPTLVAIAKQADDPEEREKAIAMLAGKNGYSQSRAQVLLELLQERDLWVYYAVIDGLVGMGQDVLPQLRPLLDDDNPPTRALAEEVLRKLEPESQAAQPVDGAALLASYLQASDAYNKQEIAVSMAASGEPELLDFLLARPDDRVLNGPVLSVVTNRLIENLRHYKFQPTQDLSPRRTALRTLAYIGVLTAEEQAAFASDIENPDLGDQVRDLRRARLAAPIRNARPEAAQ